MKKDDTEKQMGFIYEHNQKIIESIIIDPGTKEKYLDENVLADALGMSKSSFSKKKKDDLDLLKPTNIGKIVRNLFDFKITREDGENEEDYQKRKREKKQSIDKAISVLQKLALDQVTEMCRLTKNNITDYASGMNFMIKMPSVIWQVKQDTQIQSTLEQLLVADSVLHTITIGIGEYDFETVKAELEAGCYGENGNYSKVVNIDLKRLSKEPIAEMFGCNTGQGLKVLVRNEENSGFFTHPDLDIFADDLEAIKQASANWSVLSTPKARGLEYLLRECGSLLNPEIRSFLRDQQHAFENHNSLETARDIWPLLQQNVLEAASVSLSMDDTQQLQNAFEFMQLKQG